MEILSKLIQKLFAGVDGMDVIRRAGLVPHHGKYVDKVMHLDVDMNESFLMNLLMKDSSYNTMDQRRIVSELFFSKWGCKNYRCKDVDWFQEYSVFNSLLNFSTRALYLVDDEPVCHYDMLLRWHHLTTFLGEDIITTSYLAASDTKRDHHREYFDWAAYTPHDNKELNALFFRPMADLHMHLKGSSFNFDLSWLSLMNNIDSLHGVFMSLQQGYNDEGWNVRLYNQLYFAAHIRMYLAGRTGLVRDALNGPMLFRTLSSFLDEKSLQEKETKDDDAKDGNAKKDDTSWLPHFSFDTTASTLRSECASQTRENIYAEADYIPVHGYYDKAGANFLLSSERIFLYTVFRDILKGGCLDSSDASLFYAYLCIKTNFRMRLVQMNDMTGFSNFGEYEKLKDSFITGVYETYLYKCAIESFLCGRERHRYLETRIAPKESAEEIAGQITKINDAVDPRYKNRFGIIFHFIKKRDERKEGFTTYQHQELHEKLKRQAFAIYRFRNTPEYKGENPLVGQVVGIDAANSELACRPEVFACAFRFLRAHGIEGNATNSPDDLHVTFHVGEDFYDVADGLRAIDEAMIFLELRNGDRLGHCLALGTDVRTYYSRRNYTICATKQVLLDNMAWLHHKCRRLLGNIPLCYYLEQKFHRFFAEVYGPKENELDIRALDMKQYDKENEEFARHDNIRSYYLSWLLRANFPKFAVNKERPTPKSSIEKEWRIAEESHHPGIENAMHDPVALQLFDWYHNEMYAGRGCEAASLTIWEEYREDFFRLLEAIQEHLLGKIERRRIAIECNPTSNYKIGDFENYDEHPILRFYNVGLNTPYTKHSISVSINTDDQGVFSTCLEREYSLIAQAMERNHKSGFDNTPRQYIDWLDKIREMTIEQQFTTTEKLNEIDAKWQTQNSI